MHFGNWYHQRCSVAELIIKKFIIGGTGAKVYIDIPQMTLKPHTTIDGDISQYAELVEDEMV